MGGFVTRNERTGEWSPTPKLFKTIGFSLLGLFLFIFFNPIVSVPTGHVGVVTLYGKVEPETLESGIHLINPLERVNKVSVQVEAINGTFEGASRDLQQVHVVMGINLRVNPTAAAKLFRDIGPDYANKVVSLAASETLKAELAHHKVADTLENRPIVKENVQANLTTWLAKYDIEVKEVSLADIKFSGDYEKAIENKQLEEQKALQKTYELQQAETNAKIVAANAKGDADAKIAEATGKAQALTLTGEAQANYNEKVAKSLTAPLLTMKYYERWDGKLPNMMLGNNASTLIQLPSNTEK